MKFFKILSILLLAVGVFALKGCSNDDDSKDVISDVRLLPVKISTDYRSSAKRIYSYDYDGNNRLTEYRETRYYGTDISLQDIETTCRIIYGDDNRIDSMIISPLLINIDTVLANSLYELVSDTIVFSYEGQFVFAKRNGKVTDQISVGYDGRVLVHKYTLQDEKQIYDMTVNYQYDNNGNIHKYTIDNGIDAPQDLYTYSYDKKNGIFRFVNTPQWFLTIMINQEFNFLNNYKEYMDNNSNRWAVVYEYNNESYPVYFRVKYEGEGHMLLDDSPSSVNYIPAK